MRFLLGFFLTLSACQEQKCTDLGCINGVSITIKDPSGEVLTVEKGHVVVDDDTENPIVFDCTDGSLSEDYSCLDDDVIIHITEGSSLQYTIEAEGYVDTGMISIDLEESFPNGEDCDACYYDSQTIYLEDVPVEPDG